MKIAFFEVKNWEKKYLRKKLPDYELLFFPHPVGIDDVKKIKDISILSVFIYSKIDKNFLKYLPKLKFITTRSTGFDHIDISSAAKKKILVSNVPFYGENTVAEHTFALILSLSRNVHKAYLKTLSHNFSIEGLEGFDLKGKTLGVIGAGHIGLHVIRIAKGFGMEVLAYDVNQNKFISEVLDFKYVSLKDLLRKSDIITIHTPYNKNTHHLINKETIKWVKKGAILINTSRGAIVDTESLLKALDEGAIAGAGLDVLEGEDLIKEEKQLLYDGNKIQRLSNLVKDHLLLSKENVVFTPHIAFYSREALERILETTVFNILSFCEGKPKNVVNIIKAKSVQLRKEK